MPPSSLLYRIPYGFVVLLIIAVFPVAATPFYGGTISSPGVYELQVDVQSGSHITGERGEITITCGNVTLYGNSHIIDGYHTPSPGDTHTNNHGVVIYNLARLPNITIGDCIIRNCSTGISFLRCDSGGIISNTVVNSTTGISLDYSRDITMSNNNMHANTNNFGIEGSSPEDYQQVIDTSNMLDGRPLYYIRGQSGAVINATVNPGAVYSYNSDSLIISDLNLSGASHGICLVGTNGSHLSNITATGNGKNGISLFNSNNNTINRSTIRNSEYFGVQLENSHNNTISSIDAQNNGNNDQSGGVGLIQSTGNSISDCNLDNNYYYAVKLADHSNFNTVARNQGNTSLFGYTSGSPVEPPGAFEMVNSDDNFIFQNTVFGYNISCILLYQSNRTTIQDNNLWKKTTLKSRAHYPILAYYSQESQIIGNEIGGDDDGIYTQYGSDSNRIADNTFMGLGGCAFRVGSDNIITGNYADGTVPFGMGSSTEFHVEGSNNLLFNNTILFANGICIKGENNRIIQNTLQNSTVIGISNEVGSSLLDNGIIADNTITGSYEGIRISTSRNVTIRNNTVEWTNGWDRNALSCSAMNDSYIQNNTLRNNRAGIWLSGAANNTISGNRVQTPTSWYSYAFDFTDITNHTIYNNYLLNDKNIRLSGTNQNNTWNVTVQAGPNIFGGPSIGGNLWASPYGTGFSQQHDDRGDGFCDSAYSPGTDNTDHLPLAGRTILPAPVVAGIEPNTGSAGSSLWITSLTGSGFLPNASVSLNRTGCGSINATNVTLLGTEIYCFLNLANAAPGSWDVVVINPDHQGGIGSGLFHVTGTAGSTPTVSTVSPASGTKGTNVSMTITGTNFTTGSQVNLVRGVETIAATNVINTSKTKISCSFALPLTASSGAWNLTVTNNFGQQGTKTNVFTLNPAPAPTFSSITPTSGFKNTTFSFSVSGNNFPAGSVVNFTNSTYGNITWTPGTITTTKITGSVLFPPGTPAGKWDVVVTTPDGRNATKKGAFTVNAWKKPTVSSITPTSGYRNATLSFSLSGTNFQAGALVNFTNATYGSVTATVSSVTLTKITGSVLFPPGAPTGKWDITVMTPDGGQSVPKTGAFTVNPWKVPTISSIAPTSGLLNTTTALTLSGTGFQLGAVVNFSNAIYPGGNLTAAITVVSPTKITGTLLIPYNAPTGKWSIVITTPDGGQSVPKAGAFSVKDWSKPTITSINQTKGVHGTTINYAITGTNFQPGSTVTFTNSSAAGLNFTAAVTTTVPAKIIGSVTVPANRTGKYGIEVICPDGKKASKPNAFTVT